MVRAWAGRYARLMWERCQGNKREAARVLGISDHTLTTYLKANDAEGGVERFLREDFMSLITHTRRNVTDRIACV